MDSLTYLSLSSVPQKKKLHNNIHVIPDSLSSSSSSSSPQKIITAEYSSTQTSPNSNSNSNKPPSLVSKSLNKMDAIINNYIDPPKNPSFDPNIVLSGNYAPVEELPPTQCEIEHGVLPSCLNGAYIRNGPNPQFKPRGPYHLFDGDGMLHSIRIWNGTAVLCSRYVKTYKYKIEHEAGYNVLPNLFSGFSSSLVGSIARGLLATARFIAGEFDTSNGFGLANTSLAFFGNKLYALCESDLPYEVKLDPNGDIQTVCRTDFEGKLIERMTAHPKVDLSAGGEAFAFRYDIVRPFLTYFRFDWEGNKQEDVPIFSLKRPPFLHDFAITKKYSIFADIQIEMDLVKMMVKGTSPIGFKPTKVSKIGVIPRYAKDDTGMRWYDVPGLNMLHAINAWDEVDEYGNEIVVLLAPNMMNAQHLVEKMHLTYSLVEIIRINLCTGLVTRKPVSARNLELGVINPAYLGKKNKYVYAAVGDPTPLMTGVVKLDVSMAGSESTVAGRVFGPNCYGGEPYFVASYQDHDDDDATDDDDDEDEGYLVSFVHDENKNESRFIVMDAKSPNLDVVASVKLPQRVPYGFHGLFVREKDLNSSLI